MKRLWVILLLISFVWGQKQTITLKKNDDFILVNQKDKIKIVTKENNEFKTIKYDYKSQIDSHEAYYLDQFSFVVPSG